MEVHVSLTGRRQLSEQIYRQLRSSIRDGRLRPPDLLPSSRELANRLDVSRNTVVAAYERLAAEGLVLARPGTGVFVRDAEPARTAPPRPEPAAHPQPQPVWATIRQAADLSAARPDIDLRAGIPSREHFPYPAWRSVVSRQLRPSVLGTSAYAEPAGQPALGRRSPGTSRCPAACGPARTRSSSPAGRSRRSTWWPACCSPPAIWSRSRIRATGRPRCSSGRCTCGWPACRWTARASTSPRFPTGRGWST